MCHICETIQKYGHELFVHIANHQIPPDDMAILCGYLLGTILETRTEDCDTMADFLMGMAHGRDITAELRRMIQEGDFLEMLAKAEPCRTEPHDRN